MTLSVSDAQSATSPVEPAPARSRFAELGVRVARETLERDRAAARWEVWLARGVRHDLAVRRRFRIAAGVAVVAAAAWLLWML